MKRKPLERRLEIALELLERYQGEKRWRERSEPLDALILTLLSQNTNDRLRDQAYQRLRERFPTWSAVLAASREQVEAEIQIAGLSRQKAERMLAILNWVQEQFDELSLRELENVSDDDAIARLCSQKGIGIKTAAVTLMAALGRDLCPVDTHVHRIAQRLGWVPASASAVKTFELLRPHVPAGRGHSLHMNLLQFGRTICQARKPCCGTCFLFEECVWEGKPRDKNEPSRPEEANES